MEWMFDRADQRVITHASSPSEALEAIYQTTCRRLIRTSSCRLLDAQQTPVVFVCDVGLGGLARWLRAAGYMAYWREGAGDAELIEEARTRSAVLVTTDSGMMERRVLRDGHLPAIWVSPGLNKMQQLDSVLSELAQPRLTPRCMKCGGELEVADKESMAGRIPPKTYRWRNDYFLCRSCGKLFWHGSHWRKIDQLLTARYGDEK